MHRRLLFYVIICSVLFQQSSLYAQHYLGKTKTELIKKLNKQDNKPVITDMDSFLLVHLIKSPGEQKLKFDDKMVCISEEFIARDRESYNVLLKTVLDKKDFDWKKINENQYVSRFKDFMMIELPVEPNDYSFMVFRTTWSQELYKLLTGN